MPEEKAKRILMVRSTDLVLPRSRLPHGLSMRNLTDTDAEALGDLLYHAYLNTVDDEGGSLEDARQEARETIDGRYGPVLYRASFVLEGEAAMCCATVVTSYQRTGPLLAFVATRPGYQKLGLGRRLIAETMRSLSRSGIRELRLVVTESNVVAFSLYRKLGFVVDDDSER